MSYRKSCEFDHFLKMSVSTALLLMAVCTVGLPATIQAQDRTATADYKPDRGSNGPEISMTIRYRFDMVQDELWLRTDYEMNPSGATAYWYNGQRYVGSDVEGLTTALADFSGAGTFEADLYKGNTSRGTFTSSPWGGSPYILTSGHGLANSISKSEVNEGSMSQWRLENVRIIHASEPMQEVKIVDLIKKREAPVQEVAPDSPDAESSGIVAGDSTGTPDPADSEVEGDSQKDGNGSQSGNDRQSGAGTVAPTPVINPDNNRIIDDEMLGFLNSAAEDSDNPRFKNMVEEFNSYRANASEQKSFVSSFVPLSQQDYDEYNMAENMAQAVSVGKFIIGSIFGKKKSKEETISPSQREAESSMTRLSRQLRELYDEIQTIPNYYSYDESTLSSLNEIESKLYRYERVTATSRLLYLRFTMSNRMLDMEDIASLSQTIDEELRQNGMDYILNELRVHQIEYPDIENVPHMANAEYGFRKNLNTIRIIRAKSLRNLGRIAEAEKVEADITYDIRPYNAVRLLYSAYQEKNYYESIQFYHSLKGYFSEHTGGDFIYLDLPHMTANFEGLYRTDATYLLGTGVLAHLSSGKISQAQQELKFLRQFHSGLEKAMEENKQLRDRQKAFGTTDAEFEAYYRGSESIILTVEAALMRTLGDHQLALEKIDQALQLNAEGSTGSSSAQKYEPWMFFQKARILVELEEYEAAREAVRMARTEYQMTVKGYNAEFDTDELSFLLAYMRFKEQEYNSALLAVRILERRNPEVAKYHLLEEDIYKKLGDQQKADEAREKYLNKITAL